MLKIQVQVASVCEADLLDRLMNMIQPGEAYENRPTGVGYAPDPPGSKTFSDILQYDDYYSLTAEQFAQLVEGSEMLPELCVRLDITGRDTTIADLVHFGEVLGLSCGLLQYCQSCRRLTVDCAEQREAIAVHNEVSGSPVPWDESTMKGSMD